MSVGQSTSLVMARSVAQFHQQINLNYSDLGKNAESMNCTVFKTVIDWDRLGCTWQERASSFSQILFLL